MKFKVNDLVYRVVKHRLSKTEYILVRICDFQDKNNPFLWNDDEDDGDECYADPDYKPDYHYTIQGSHPLIIEKYNESHWFPECSENELLSEQEYRKIKLEKINKRNLKY